MELKNKKGFTIIELIVVIAIISVLTAIIVPAVNIYKSKSREVAIKNEFSQLATFGTIYSETSANGFSDFCSALSVQPFFQKISEFAIVDPREVRCDNGQVHFKVCCDNDNSAWAACVQLVMDENKAWCADSTGTRKQITKNQCSGNLGGPSNPPQCP